MTDDRLLLSVLHCKDLLSCNSISNNFFVICIDTYISDKNVIDYPVNILLIELHIMCIIFTFICTYIHLHIYTSTQTKQYICSYQQLKLTTVLVFIIINFMYLSNYLK